MRHSRAVIAPAALALILVTGAALSGCSDGASGQADATATQSASAPLPADFPKTDVPLIDGDVLVATGDAESGWSITVIPSAKGGLAAAVKLLGTAGYTTSSSKPASAYLSGPKYDVLLSSPGDTVTYAVSPAA